MDARSLAAPLTQLLILTIGGVTKDRDIRFIAVVNRVNLLTNLLIAAVAITIGAITGDTLAIAIAVTLAATIAITIDTIAIHTLTVTIAIARTLTASKGQTKRDQKQENEFHCYLRRMGGDGE